MQRVGELKGHSDRVQPSGAFWAILCSSRYIPPGRVPLPSRISGLGALRVGAVVVKRFIHSDGKTEKFYTDLKLRGANVRVGMEYTGHPRWFGWLLAAGFRTVDRRSGAD